MKTHRERSTVCEIAYSNFEFVSDFGFRISDLFTAPLLGRGACGLCLLLSFWAFAAPAQSSGDATISIQVDQPGAVVSSNLFGTFFEEINYAGEGGLYAEMVRNRSFANSSNPDFWTLVVSNGAVGQMTVDTSVPLNTNTLQALKLTKSSGTGSAGIGAANAGFWGMRFQAGSNYVLSFYAMRDSTFSGTITARLQSSDGSQTYAQSAFTPTARWQRFSTTMTPSASDTNGRLVLTITQNGTVWLDVVSLFPQATFNGRANGLRADLAGMLDDVHPSFLRYPGGNFIEANFLTNSVRWKETIGDIALRPGHRNDSWGYWSTDGFGLHEFLQFCEDVGMEPLYGINCGLALGYNGSTNNTVPLDQMGPWIQDALDLIQYADGDTNTTWGGLRAANGHPAPFHLKYLEIGNENGGSYYNDRYALFYDAIKAAYPDIHLIACVWGGIPTSRPVEIQDEHYYSSPGTFISFATKYDSYSRAGPKVFVGEYAVTEGYGNLGNMSAALGEAAFMTGMERNSDVVQLASYAPLFANVNGTQWHPDLIYYDSSRTVGTPSYYVQRLFSQNRGDIVLPATIAMNAAPTNPPPRGAFGLGSWNTSVQYSNIVVTSNGVTLYQSDFVNAGTSGWRVYNGTWNTNAGAYQQTALITDCRSTTGNTNWASYRISLRARKVSGSEGFLILFNWLDDNNWTWWNVGGWNNTLDGIEQMSGGAKTTLAQVSQTAIQSGQWYNIQIVLTGSRMQCYLDANLVQDVTYPAATTSGLLASSTYHKASGQAVLKVVNSYSLPVVTTFNFSGVNAISPNGTIIQLSSASPSDENSLSAPKSVFPVTNAIANAGTRFTLTLAANSVSVLRLQPLGINTFTNLQIQLDSPLNVGQAIAAVLWGWQTGQSTPVNLATNSNHAIAWASADSSVAAVDLNGSVIGVGPGTTTITASYPALGLSAAQSVRVVGQPKALVHRYSFSESPGSTTAADSIGGPAWNGTLPNGGTFDAGQLALASSSRQYLQLPSGILNNYPAVTIETWVTFWDQLPVNCFFFGFGNTNGGSGQGYIFCAPQGGRIAITPSDFTGEQNAYASAEFSFHTNFHLAAVFNPPAGYLSLYTNGVLAGINTTVTVPMRAVDDVFSYVGRSLYSGDPYPDFTLDEFRIYSGALSPSEISATQALGPNQLLSTARPALSVAAMGTSWLLAWPVAAAGWALQSSLSLLPGSWTNVSSPAPQIAGSQWQVTLPGSPSDQFFRLTK